MLSCDTQPAAARSTVRLPPIHVCAFTEQLRQAPLELRSSSQLSESRALLSQQRLMKSSVPVGCGHASQSRILVLQSFVSPGLLQY